MAYDAVIMFAIAFDLGLRLGMGERGAVVGEESSNSDTTATASDLGFRLTTNSDSNHYGEGDIT